ncbi:hypothetical protein QJQ45_030255, partial [Haematococcus lacustris]
EGAVVPSEVVEARLYDQLVLWVEACSKRALLASLLLGLMVRGCFTRVTVLADGQELLEEIPADDAVIPDLAERNLYLQLGRGTPPPGMQSRPSLAVVAVLAAHPGLRDELNAVPRYPHDCNTVDDVGQKLRLALPTASPSSNNVSCVPWLQTVRGAMVRCNSAATGRPLALACVVAGFSSSGSIGSKGVPVKQMLREACKQFPGHVVMVHEFRTSRVSSARTKVVAGQAESFWWLRPVRSMATRSRIRGLMCSTSTGIRFYDRDVSAALNIRRIAAGPGRPRELSTWLGRPAMPNPGRPDQARSRCACAKEACCGSGSGGTNGSYNVMCIMP